ncbi:hypothetical protein IJ103_00085 [Candidatus Saccharibacteria bacterium]|nr:hypothetical protein [Candidatus Saccharibacteria bacterium]
MAKNIGVGVQLTADASAFKKSIDDVSAAVARNQKATIRAAQETRDAFGVLRDDQGRIVEGLTKWQKDLGYYVDDLGRVRTANDRFVDGLTTLQKKIGLEIDEAGTVYNRAGEIVEGLNKSAQQATQAAVPAFDSIDQSLSKISRDALLAANGFNGLKGGLDVLFGAGNKLSAVVDGVGKIAHSALAFQQIRDQIKLLREQFGGLSKAAQVARAAFSSFSNAGGGFKGVRAGLSSIKAGLKSVEAEAVVAQAQLALIGAAIGATIAIHQKLIDNAISTIDPALKGLDQYRERYEEIARAAKDAGASVESLGDALKYAGQAGGDKANLEQFIKALKANQETGMSSEGRAVADNGLGVFRYLKQAFNPVGASIEQLTGQEAANNRAIIKGLDSIGADWATPGKSGESERQELFAAISSFVDRFNEQYGEQKKESDKIAADIEALQLIIEAVGDDNERKQELETLAQTMRERQAAAIQAETEAARAKILADAGIDKYLQTQDKTAQAVADYGATVEKWRALVDDGTISGEQFEQASGALASSIRGALLQRLGVQLPAAVDDTAKAFAELQDAVDAGVLSSDDYGRAVQSLQEAAARKLAQAAGLDFSPESPSAFQIAPQGAGETFEQLRARLDKSFEQFKERLDDSLARQEIAQSDYERLLASYKEKSAETLQASQDAAAQALASAQGLDLDAPRKAAQAAKSLETQLEEWKDAARAGTISQEALSKAEAALTLAISERDKAAKEEAEKARETARKQALQDTGINALRSQAQALEKETTWRGELEETMKQARKAYKDGTITLQDLNQAHKDYKAIVKAKTKEEKAQARDAARQTLGVDSLMESLKSPAQKLNETLNQIGSALASSFIDRGEYDALRSKAFQEYRDALDDFNNGQTGGDAPKAERVAAGSSLSDSREFYKAVVNQMSPRSYEKKIEDTTARLAETQDAAYRAQVEGNELLAQFVAGAGLAGVPVFG